MYSFSSHCISVIDHWYCHATRFKCVVDCDPLSITLLAALVLRLCRLHVNPSRLTHITACPKIASSLVSSFLVIIRFQTRYEAYERHLIGPSYRGDKGGIPAVSFCAREQLLRLRVQFDNDWGDHISIQLNCISANWGIKVLNIQSDTVIASVKGKQHCCALLWKPGILLDGFRGTVSLNQRKVMFHYISRHFI